jgi:hypothetical protein
MSSLIQGLCANKNTPKEENLEKFKIIHSYQRKHIKLQKGERVTPAHILKVMTAAKDIDSQATKARSRIPQSTNEWRNYLNFHLSHMDGSLHEDMCQVVQNSSITNTSAFWTEAFKRIFPVEIARDTFDKTLLSYMIWNEPMGLERWEVVTLTLLQHQCHMNGTVPSDMPLAIAKGLEQQLERVVLSCPGEKACKLHAKYSDIYTDIGEAKESYQPISCEMYEQANSKFLKYLRKQINTFPYDIVFGHLLPKERKVNEPNQVPFNPTPSSLPPQLNHIPHQPITDPSYSQVTQVGGQGYGGQPPPRQTPTPYPVKEFKPKPFGFDTNLVAPTGIIRTFKWNQNTKPADGSARIPCNDPPPPECTEPKCVYYGDWLDFQKICSYCLSKDHLKVNCKTYNNAVEAHFKKNQAMFERQAQQTLLANAAKASNSVAQEN